MSLWASTGRRPRLKSCRLYGHGEERICRIETFAILVMVFWLRLCEEAIDDPM